MSRTLPRRITPAASAHGRSASSAGPLSWLPPTATTWAPVPRNAVSARVTSRVASGVGARCRAATGDDDQVGPFGAGDLDHLGQHRHLFGDP